jgi:hypothetical protein
MKGKLRNFSEMRLLATLQSLEIAVETTLALELEYREPSIFHEIGTESERPTELQTQGDCLKMSLHAS